MYKTIIPLILLLITIVNSAFTYPRLSVEHKAPCKNCHISPSGGGMRTEFANYAVALNELTLPSTKNIAVKNYKAPRLSESVTFGFDTRHLIFDDATIFRMQTDFFANIELFENMNYNLRFSENGISENYGIFYTDKKKHYVRFGRFAPSFGLKQSDHKSYNRERLGHGSLTYLDGLGVGIEIGGHLLNAELVNYGQQTIFMGHLMKSGNLKSIGIFGGASLQLPEEEANHSRFPQAKAIFGGLSYNRFTFMGEVDLVGKSNDTLSAYVNLTSRLEYGLYLIGEYNFFDGNRNLANGVDEFYRFSVEFYPISFFQIRPSYTYYTEGYKKDQSDFFVQVHFGY